MKMSYKKIGGLFPVVCSTASQSGGAINFESVNTGLSVTDRVGWLLKFVEDFSPAGLTSTLFADAGDNVSYGLALSNSINPTSPGTALILPQMKWVATLRRADFGTAASGFEQNLPVIYNYDTAEDAGIIMVPQPLYSFCGASTSITGAFTSLFRAWFQAVQLSDADYFNMLQANQLLVA